MLRFIVTALPLAITATLSASAAFPQETDPDATIRIGSIYEPQNLDNTKGAGQGITEAFNGNVYQGLFRLSDSGQVEPVLAEVHVISDDGLTHTFTLKDGVSFHSGDPLTAADIKYSIERVTAEDSQSSRRSSLSSIDSIATPDDRTVEITLKSRSISLPYNLSYVWIVNDAAGDITNAEDGTGPYTLAGWRRGSTLALDRWDDYWGDAPKNSEVIFRYFTDATSLSNAMLSGAVDIITSVQSPDLLALFTENPDFTVEEGQSTTKLLMAYNDRKAPFDDPKVRGAIARAIDDEKLLGAIWGDYGTLIGSFVPPTDPWFVDLRDVNAYDPESAKAMLEKAGYGDGFTFTLDTPNYDPHPVAAEFIKSELAKVGVTVNINIITANEWYTKVYKAQNFDATMQEHVNHRDIMFYGNPNFYWGYNNPEVVDLIADAEHSETLQARDEKLTQANRIIAEDAASEWLYLYPQIVVSRANVTGYPLNGLNSQFFAADVTKTQ